MINQKIGNQQNINIQDCQKGEINPDQQTSKNLVTNGFKLQDNLYPQMIKKICLIQAYCRMIIQKKKYKCMKAWAIKRGKVYEELIQTEVSYLADLKIVLEKVIKNVKEMKLLSDIEIQKAFSNISQIYDLNKAFLRELQKKLDIYHNNVCVGHIFLKYIPFFKMYFQYLQEFKIDQISILRSQYQEFDNFLNNLEEACVFKGGDLNSFLIKPVQRLPRYSLLITSVVKYTWKDHPDYQDLQKTLNQFASVTQQIDLLIGNILKNQALFELQYKFFNLINVQIVESTRQFILTESLYMINQGQEEQINLYLCTDLIVLTKMSEENQKYIKEGLITYSFLDLQSYYKNEQVPSLNFTLVAGEQQMMFICQDQEQKIKLQQEFDSLFANLKNNASQRSANCKKKTQIYSPIKVQIVSITRGQELLKSYAQYNIIVINQSQSYAIQTRHKVLLKLQKKLEIEFQQESKSETGSNILFQNWIKNRLNKEQNDGRKVIVQEFLETLLNSHLVKSRPEYFLRKLKLPQNFYIKHDMFQSNNNSLAQSKIE
ncbi:unnamed protein product [Paramecium primaurelia]|uniref:DH domain-containing protein n=1 Tax=Paramecium primaurelia TaxID=5886 RepID=A0A8S1KTR0_PARPR|nr:unnamed protein product [Paramecium primaurelia]